MKVCDETRNRYNRPLILIAAENIIISVKKGDCVLIITNSNETVGLLGAIALARSLIIDLKAISVILSDFFEDRDLKTAFLKLVLVRAISQ